MNNGVKLIFWTIVVTVASFFIGAILQSNFDKHHQKQHIEVKKVNETDNITLIHLEDGTLCVVYKEMKASGVGVGLDCDWSRNSTLDEDN